jgi:dicarboxylate transporter 10
VEIHILIHFASLEPTFLQLLFCSTSAGALGGAFGNPSDVVNVRMQNDGQLPPAIRRNYRNAIDGLIRICREEHPKVLARGIGPNMNRAILMTCSQLTSYDVFKEFLLGKVHLQDGFLVHLESSIFAVSNKVVKYFRVSHLNSHDTFFLLGLGRNHRVLST